MNTFYEIKYNISPNSIQDSQNWYFNQAKSVNNPILYFSKVSQHYLPLNKCGYQKETEIVGKENIWNFFFKYCLWLTFKVEWMIFLKEY